MMKNLLFLAFAISTLCFSCNKKPVGGAIDNTFWTLSTLQAGTKVVNMSDSTRTSLIFGVTGLSGEAPCNNYFAEWAADGSILTVAGLGATERMCDNINLENQYLGLLGKAYGYSVLTDQLVVFADGGELTFRRMSEQAQQQLAYEQGVGQLVAKFPALTAEAPPHLYPIIRVDNPGNYPYQGVKVDTAAYRFFDRQSSEIWNNTGGDVYAVGKFGDFFICRVPGRYVSSDIALFQLKNGQLQRTETIAWAWCDEGWCNQQDAWLTDLDQDGRIDIVQRYTLTDDRGKVREQHLKALVQSPDGSFKEDPGQKINAANYPMAKI